MLENNPISGYAYRANITKIIDGDTVEAVVDVGFHVHVTERFRLFGIDTPELHGETKEAGQKAKQFLVDNLLDKYCVVKSYKADSFGRWLADVYYVAGQDMIHVNRQLLELGLAVEFRSKI